MSASVLIYVTNILLAVMEHLEDKRISNRTKTRQYKSNVLSVLVYAAQSWKVNKGIRHLRIYWSNTISNKELHERTDMQPIFLEVKRRRWRWMRQICRMLLTSILRVPMGWTPGGKRARGKPKETTLAAGSLFVALCVISHKRINLT